MVDALGGVPICAPEAIDDPKAKLKLSAGRHVLDGAQALGYVRARKTLGDGSDLGRIERQQAFLSSVVQEATRTSLLLRPDKLFGFLDAATRSLTTDEEFDLGTMKDLASSVQDIGCQEHPVHHRARAGVPGRPQPGRVGPSADVLWQTLRDDGVVGAKPTATASALDGAAHREPDGGRGRGRQRHRRRRGWRRRWPRRSRCRASRSDHEQLGRPAERCGRRVRPRAEGGGAHRGRGVRGGDAARGRFGDERACGWCSGPGRPRCRRSRTAPGPRRCRRRR